ncbi:MAG: GNAT family N-acetyltransferase [Lachnospiraceae bacterium]|nr:GNAT family N-acetyltransferase [Lachnospiraceae bacterium]MBR1856884.1 GNAT family N-acetyltransferase [Oribacterium sp.]
MKTSIYTLDRETLEEIRGQLPDYVTGCVHEPGYVTLGAVDGHDDIVGMVQFFVNITDDGGGYAEIDYIYTADNCRRQGVGSKLLNKVNRILKKSGVLVSTVLVPVSDQGAMVLDTPAKELKAFFEDCNYIKSTDSIHTFQTVLNNVFQGLNDKSVIRYARLAGRE